jgi:hypothetical protein
LHEAHEAALREQWRRDSGSPDAAGSETEPDERAAPGPRGYRDSRR